MRKNNLILYGLPWLRVAIFVLFYLVISLVLQQSLEDIAPYWPLLFIIGNIITILIFNIILNKENDSFLLMMKRIWAEKISIKGFIVTYLLMNIVGIGGMIGFSFLFFQGPPTYLIYDMSIWLGIIYFIFFPISAGLSETPFYYGYAQKNLLEKGVRLVPSLAYISIIYAVQHAFLPYLWDLKIILFRILSFLPLMIVIGVLYFKNRRLKDIVITHTIMDFFTVVQMFM